MPTDVRYQPQADEPANDVPDVTTTNLSGSLKKKCFGDGFRVIVAGCIIFSCVIIIGLLVDKYAMQSSRSTKGSVVVTDAEECSIIAADIIKDGGNAVDAAIAAMFCLSVVRLDLISLGGGGIMQIHSEGRNQIIDCQFASLFSNRSKGDVAVPGLPYGLILAQKRYGKKSWSRLIEPSIHLAADGFIVSNATAANIQKMLHAGNMLSVKLMLTINGTLAKAGDRLKLPVFSKTLRSIIDKGWEPLDILNRANTSLTSLTVKDLTTYKAIVKDAITIKFHGYDVYSSSSPTSGLLLLSALNILGQLPKQNASVTYEYILEALKTVFAEVRSIQDPMFDASQANISTVLLSSDFAKSKASKILHGPPVSMPSFNDVPVTTARVAVIDGDGEAVSLTSSFGGLFGSGITTNSDLIMNNGLIMFNTKKKNNVKQIERPFSFFAPVMVFGEKAGKKERYVFSPSVDMQGLAALVEVLMNIFSNGMTPSDAILQPRVFPNVAKNSVEAEGSRFSNAKLNGVLDFLKSRYANMDDSVKSIGTVIMSYRTSRESKSVVDPRL